MAWCILFFWNPVTNVGQIALLPFIDEAKLAQAIKGKDKTFTSEEKQRNTLGHELVLFHKDSPMAKCANAIKSRKDKIELDAELTCIFGFVQKEKDLKSINSGLCPSPVAGLPDLTKHCAKVYRYEPCPLLKNKPQKQHQPT